jgi:O-antigen/teichoic acid export membrane protein
MNIKKIYFWNYTQRAINALGGILLVIIISIYYDVKSAGEFYAVYSLIGTVVFFEFGYSVLVVQRVSKYLDANTIQKKKDRDIDVLHYLTIIKYYICFFLIVFPILAYAVLKNIQFSTILVLVLTLALGLNILLSMLGNIIEGLGYIEDISKIRAIQSVVNYVALLLCLIFGMGSSAVIIQLIFQISSFMILIFIFLKQRHPVLIHLKHVISLPKMEHIDTGKFKLDFKYSFQLYITVVAAIFTNQTWIIAISISGATQYISKIAMTLQIINAAAGFALTPIASRLAQLSKARHMGSREDILLLLRRIVKDTALASIFAVALSASIYFVGNSFFPEKIVTSMAAYLFILSLPLLIATNLTGIVIQSGGSRDTVGVSLVRILIPSVIFLLIDKNTSDIQISIYYLITVSLSFVVATLYLFREFRELREFR